jgi:hypothetical protein
MATSEGLPKPTIIAAASLKVDILRWSPCVPRCYRQLCGNRSVSAVHASLKELLLLVAVFVVHEWLLDGNRNDVENVGRLLEDHVHLLQRPVPGLGEEEVDDGEDGEVDDGEDCVRMVLDGLEGHRSNHDDLEQSAAD